MVLHLDNWGNSMTNEQTSFANKQREILGKLKPFIFQFSQSFLNLD